MLRLYVQFVAWPPIHRTPAFVAWPPIHGTGFIAPPACMAHLT
jgi:hypothetical protein